MKKIIYIAFCFISFIAKGQSIDLQSCYKKATENYPLLKQKEMINNSAELKIKNLNSNYLPQLNLNAQATYQSEVTKMTLNIPGINIPENSKDMYKSTLDINQLIWDGGSIAAQKKIETINTENEQQNIENETYKLKERINQLYFNILILKKNKELLEISKKDIGLKLQKVESGVKNGMVNENNADNLSAEVIKIEQKIIEILTSEKAAVEMLKELCGIEIADNTNFTLPDITISSNAFENLRPELKTFEINKTRISETQNLLTSKLMPKIYGFGQLGYGRPGLNMLSNEFQSFYIIGAKISWNIWNWNQTQNEKKILDIQKDIITNNKEVYQKNMKIAYQRDKAEIEKFSELILKDLEIIVLKTKIAKNSSSQFDNGYITSNDYLNDVNAETMAKINLEIHKIQLVKAKFDYMVTLGKL